MTEVAERLSEARRAGRAAALVAADIPATQSAAYGQSLAQMQEIAAWKIGGANPWSRRVFNNSEVFVGPLHPREVALGGDNLSLAGLNRPLAEPEVMLQIADLAATTPAGQFSHMALGFEIPAAVLPEELKPLLNAQICDRAGAGLLWITAVERFEAARFAAPFDITLRHNDDAPATGGSANIIGGPLGAAAELLALAPRHGLPLLPGQWIASGGLCPAVAVAAGDRLELAAWDQVISLRFDG